MMEVRTQQSGRIEDVSPLDLLQSLGIYRRAGCVLFVHAHGTSQLWFEAGEIVDAHSGALRGAAAVHRIVGHDRGEFRVEITGEPRARTIEASGAGLIFEAARRLDEGQRLRARLPAADVVLTSRGVASKIPGATEALQQTAERFGDGATLGEVLERSPLGELETLQHVDELVERGLLEPTGAVREPPRLPSSLPPPLSIESLAGLGPAPRELERPQPIVPELSYGTYESPPAPSRRWWMPAALGGLVAVLVILGAVGNEGEGPAPADAPPLAVAGRPIAVVDTADAQPVALVPLQAPEPDAGERSAEAGPSSIDDEGPASDEASPPRAAASRRGARTRRQPESRRGRAKPELSRNVQTAARAGTAPEVEDPSALIVEARRAYASGQGAVAHRLAARSHRLRPSSDAAELMALAACSVRKPSEAARALRDVSLLRRASVRSRCKHEHGVKLKLARGGR